MQPKKLLGVLAPFCLLSLPATFISSTIAQPPTQERRYEFALIGDVPYDARQEAKFPELIQDINNSQAQFVIHDGDFKSGSLPLLG